MNHSIKVLAPLVALLWLTACGGARDTAETASPSIPPLSMPSAAVVPPALCEVPRQAAGGAVVYRMVAGRCLRVLLAIAPGADASRTDRRVLASAQAVTTGVVQVADLFDQAERIFPQFFPSHQVNRVLGPYTYRYYPESGNHVAVDGDRVYLQGPLSGGELAFIETLPNLFCFTYPTRCGTDPRPCPPLTSWTIGGRVCTPDAGQDASIASGGSFTYVDSSGPTRGAAAYICTDGTLAPSPQGTPSCDPAPPLACNTGAISWSAAGNTCTPNVGSPAQIASGASVTFTDSSGTSGAATFSCRDGVLSQAAGATCNPPAPVACRPGPEISWSSVDNLCVPSFLPIEVNDGDLFVFADIFGDVTGSAPFRCAAGTMVLTGAPVCERRPAVTDSFGGFGGSADGSANGDGTAAEGLPIVGASVVVTDTTGKRATATTDERGYYRVKLTGFEPPLVITVTRSNGGVLHSLSTQPVRTNAYIFMGVTPLTELIADAVARDAGAPGAPALVPSMVVGRQSVVDGTIEALKNDPVLAPELAAAGIPAESFDPLTVPFRADGSGYDQVLDNVVLKTDSSGNLFLAPVDCPLPASWTVGDATCTPDPSQPTIVPSGVTLIVQDSIGSTTGSAGYTCIKGELFSVLAGCRFSPGN